MPVKKGLIRHARRSGATSINLAKRRTWYADENAGEQQQQQQGEGGQNGAQINDPQKMIEALTKRLTDRDNELAQAKEQLRTIKKGQEKQLEEDGKFKTLAEERAAEVARLTPIVERAAALEKIIRESNEVRVKAVPEQMRDLIPTDYPPEKLQTWLNANEAKLVQPPPPTYNGGAGANGGSNAGVNTLTPEEKEIAKMMNMTPEQYLKAKQKTGR